MLPLIIYTVNTGRIGRGLGHRHAAVVDRCLGRGRAWVAGTLWVGSHAAYMLLYYGNYRNYDNRALWAAPAQVGIVGVDTSLTRKGFCLVVVRPDRRRVDGRRVAGRPHEHTKMLDSFGVL